MPGGRPPFQPTEKQRGQVEAMAGYGFPEAEIARALGISNNTLRKHFAKELDTGEIKANAQVAEFLFSTITGTPIPNRPQVKNDSARVTAAIFWAKTRMRWKETLAHEHAGKDGKYLENTDPKRFITAALDRIADRLTGDGSEDDAAEDTRQSDA